MRKQAHSSDKHGLHREQRGFRPWHLSPQKFFKCRLAGWIGLLVNDFRLIQEYGGIGIKQKTVEQRGCPFFVLFFPRAATGLMKSRAPSFFDSKSEACVLGSEC